MSLTEAGDDETRGGEWGLCAGQWRVGEGRVGERCVRAEGCGVLEGL